MVHTDDGPDDTPYRKSKSRWTDLELFMAWLKKVFLKHIVTSCCSFIDGHKTHIRKRVTVPPSLLSLPPFQFLHAALKTMVVIQDCLNTPEPVSSPTVNALVETGLVQLIWLASLHHEQQWAST